MGFERKLRLRSRVLIALSGPLAVQLAKYIGSLHGGTLGATLTGAAFILPLFLMVLGLASLYVHFGQLAWVQRMFYGISAAVSAIIVRSAWKLIKKTLDRDFILWILFGALAITTVWSNRKLYGFLCCPDSWQRL